jgi:hypothetical protein
MQDRHECIDYSQVLADSFPNRRTGTIRAANLGDSGFMIIRPIRFDQRSLMNGSFGEQVTISHCDMCNYLDS